MWPHLSGHKHKVDKGLSQKSTRVKVRLLTLFVPHYMIVRIASCPALHPQRKMKMPRPGTITSREHQYLTVPNLPWLNDALGSGFVRGGIYLVSGEPGVGKSTLMGQALGDLAMNGNKVLYMTNEQSLGEID